MMAPHAGLERRVHRRPRSDARAHPGGDRRLRHRPHHAAARAGGSHGPRPSASTSTSSARPARPSGSTTRWRPRRRFTINGPGALAGPAPSARAAFDRTLALVTRARTASDAPATFLLDEVLELRTFESFPGLRHVLREMLHAMAESGNRFVLTSRYVARAHRLLRDGHARFEVIHLPQLNAGEVTAMLPPMGETAPEDREFLGRTIQALADGRAAYVRALAMRPDRCGDRGGDPISALTALLTGEGALASWCSHRYELRLHKARGYGALKAILEILAEEEPLTLTEVAHRLHRTPGSTKDYLSWLEDVDLIVSRQKRYSFADPLTRLWVRLHCRPVPPSVDEVAREVQAYAMARLPQPNPRWRWPAPAASAAGRSIDDRRSACGRHHRDRLDCGQSRRCRFSVDRPLSSRRSTSSSRAILSIAEARFPPPARLPSWSRPVPCGDHLFADESLRRETACGGRGRPRRHAVRGSGRPLRLQPLLQPRLVIAAEVLRAAAHRSIPAANSRIRKLRAGVEAAVEVDRGDHRFAGVGQQRLLAASAGLLFAAAENHVIAEPQAAPPSPPSDAVETRLALIFDFCPSR